MRGRPAVITEAIPIALPRPGDRRSSVLAGQRGRLLEALELTGAAIAPADWRPRASHGTLHGSPPPGALP